MLIVDLKQTTSMQTFLLFQWVTLTKPVIVFEKTATVVFKCNRNAGLCWKGRRTALFSQHRGLPKPFSIPLFVVLDFSSYLGWSAFTGRHLFVGKEQSRKAPIISLVSVLLKFYFKCFPTVFRSGHRSLTFTVHSLVFL